MRRRVLVNLILVAIVAGLGLALWLDGDREDEATALIDRPRETVQRAGFDLAARDISVRLERRDGGWRLVEPVEAPADPSEVNSLLSVMRSPTYDTVDATAVDLAQFGLDAPERTLYYDDVTVEFGNVNPVTLRRFVRIGDRIVQINDPAGAPQNLDHSNFVHKRVLEDDVELVRIELPDWLLERTEQGGWRATARNGEGEREVSSDTALRAADEWHRARAMWTQLKRPDVTDRHPITLYPEDGEPIRLYAVRDQQLILQRDAFNAQYHLARSLTDLLLDLIGEVDRDEVRAEEAEQVPPAPAIPQLELDLD